MSECIHGLDPATCSICLHPPGRARPVPVVEFAGGPAARGQRPVQAAYEGFCGVCHRPIDVGDLICRDADDENWVHEECA